MHSQHSIQSEHLAPELDVLRFGPVRKTSAMTKRVRRKVPLTILAVLLAGCSGASHHEATSSAPQVVPKQVVPVDPGAAKFGQPFQLGKLTIIVTDAGSLPSSSPGAAPRRRLVINTVNVSTVPDREPGLAVVCDQQPQLSGGSLYADPRPDPRPFVAGKAELAGAKDTGSITVALAAACASPALQISTGGATINGLPRPVSIPMK